MPVIETSLNETERYVLQLLGTYWQDVGLLMLEGKMADTAADLVKRGFVNEAMGYYSLTHAGRSQLRSNL